MMQARVEERRREEMRFDEEGGEQREREGWRER
jgi:hypothetical protein